MGVRFKSLLSCLNGLGNSISKEGARGKQVSGVTRELTTVGEKTLAGGSLPVTYMPATTIGTN